VKKKFGTVVLALGITLGIASASWAQVGRDSPQGGGTENSAGGSTGQKGSMKGSGGPMKNGTMHNGTGNNMQSGGAGK
jgi:hypothetical protein